MKKKLNILLCDITHDTVALANEVFPLNIGYVGAYLKKELKNSLDVELCKFIDEIEELVKKNTYDIIAFSNYPWNLRAGIALSNLAKKYNPDTITVFGGPNFPYDNHEQIRFLNKHPEIDAYVFQAGEIPFTNLVKFLKDINPKMRRNKIKNIPIPGIVNMNDKNERIYGGYVTEDKDLDFIPSPYLTGLLDKFFLDRRLSPMIQTNRGCPFTCAFCADGHKSQSKVKLFSMERVKKELDYISERIDPKLQKTLFISDLNFGMLGRDIEISEILSNIFKKKLFPAYIDATTGKNSKNRVITAIKNLSGSLQMTMAMQSTDPLVLKNIKRSNIRIEDYTGLMPALRENNLSTYGEVILGLPQETLKSHLNTLNDLIHMKVDTITPHTLMMLNGAELNTDISRKKYGYKTKFRVLPRDFSVIDGNYIIETEEVVVSTDSLSFKDYITARKNAFILSMLNNPGLSVLLNITMEVGLEPIDLIKYIVDSKGSDSISKKCKVRVNKFAKDTEEELFETESEMHDYFSKKDNFEKLIKGEEGKNLMQTHVTDWIASEIEVIIDKAEQWFDEKQMLKVELIKDAINYVRAKSTKVFSDDRLDYTISIDLNYNFQEWLNNPGKPIDNFKLIKKTKAEFIIAQEQFDELERQLQIFGKNVQGIAKAYIRLGPHTLWRKCKINESIIINNETTRQSSKLSASSIAH